MNLKRGYARLSIAVVGAWVATFGTVAAFAVWQHRGWSSGLSKELSGARSPALIELYTARTNEYLELGASAIKWGLLAIPIALSFALGWWVLCGFFPPNER
jgi:hypothetical protein